MKRRLAFVAQFLLLSVYAIAQREASIAINRHTAISAVVSSQKTSKIAGIAVDSKAPLNRTSSSETHYERVEIITGGLPDDISNLDQNKPVLEKSQRPGKIPGTIRDSDTKETIPFVNVVALQNGVPIKGTTTDFDGNYILRGLTPGKYDVKIQYIGYNPKMIRSVLLKPGESFSLESTLKGFDPIAYLTSTFHAHDITTTCTNHCEQIATTYKKSALEEFLNFINDELVDQIGELDPRKNSIVITRRSCADNFISINYYNAKECPIFSEEELAIEQEIKEKTTKDKNTESIRVMLYPNPASDAVFLRGLMFSTTAYVTDALGRIVHTQEVDPLLNQINLAHLSGGYYQIRFKQKERWFHERVLLQH